jgi:hypothetical protein
VIPSLTFALGFAIGFKVGVFMGWKWGSEDERYVASKIRQQAAHELVIKDPWQ